MLNVTELDIGQGFLAAATILLLWWILQYTLSAPWWKDDVGRTIVAKDACLLGLLVPSCMEQIWPALIDPFEALTIEVCVCAGICVTMAWRIEVWWRIKRPSLPGFVRYTGRRRRDTVGAGRSDG